MNLLRIAILGVFLLVSSVTTGWADTVVLASGAGYKKMVTALTSAYTQKTGHTVDLIFGNMARVTTLAKQKDKVGLVLGDSSFLERAHLPMQSAQELGRGKLVLAFSKSVKASTVADLDNPHVSRIALPDAKKAIYGKAAREFLQSSGRLPSIQPKLLEVSTVPQVFSYIATNEVDMGFLNLTHALNVADKLGGYVLVDDSLYSPISIVVGVLANASQKKEQQDFLQFLNTPEAQAIVRKHGL
ncbi:molybdate ABC transporter substrate-binding protein [Halodesulfovibrio aestuarii]|uniref:Molybdate ABC transporter substrate-binding protein n=1 Tax=Halodesulfovibrio aestuarii TaxID=126333 RepID=A0A8G2C962_9BACT|nr:molybdate ABC transporter substrate-binding protein [Halodesulfovibrio aestuarii]SHI80439.1 molybdate transport system substrate-binding protein [Halodesulfovibrio aestuarii]